MVDTAVTLKNRVESILRKKPEMAVEHAADWPTLLIATIDPEIRSGLSELFQGFSLNTIWREGVEAAKNVLASERIAACLCGFWLQDGTYRELIRHIKRVKGEIPVIIVSPPACPHEYRDYLAAINIGALDFLCHPYRKSDLESMLRSAIQTSTRVMRQQASTTNNQDLTWRHAI
jgi:DNA-binding NtrC family response regulator